MYLRENIGTFAEEDEAYDLLTKLTWQLPIFVIASAILDLVLVTRLRGYTDQKKVPCNNVTV